MKDNESKEKRRKSMEAGPALAIGPQGHGLGPLKIGSKWESPSIITTPHQQRRRICVARRSSTPAAQTAILVCRSGRLPSSAVGSSHIPSLFKKARPRKPREMINHHKNLFYSAVDLCQFEDRLQQRASPPLRWASASSPQAEPGQNIVLVRPKPIGNPTAPMEADEKIIEEKAVCKVCFAILREEENILKTKCKCSNALIHETCVADGNNCGNCQQKVQTFPVTLVRGLSSSTPVIKKKAKKVLGRFHG